MSKSLKNQIYSFIDSTKKNGTSVSIILTHFNKSSKKNIYREINILLKTGLIFQKDEVLLFSAKTFNLLPAKITRNFKKFCFATTLDENIDFFIPAKFSRNSLFNDTVLLDEIPRRSIKNTSKKRLKEAKVVCVCEQQNINFTGTIIKIDSSLYVKPDENFDFLFKIKNKTNKIKLNSKVIAKVEKANFDFDNPTCKIIKTYGNSNKAYVCAKACIENSGVPVEFPNKVLKEALTFNIKQNKIKNRLDLTKQVIFTIDSEKAKDLDDAISISRTEFGYSVGVHIADVSNFVEFKSETDKEALKRGNSIYITNRVIPMLSTKLSNDLCSLQPNKIRLTFSVLINLDFFGNILNFKIAKTKIKSIVKGVYEEINQIFYETYENENIKKKLIKKYAKIMLSLEIMSELCSKLKNNRIKRGSPQLQSNECDIELDKHNKVIKISKKEQNLAEQIVEEFMLLANECIAKFAKKNKLAFFYRAHEKPPEEKVIALKELVNKLGINSSKIKPNLKPKILANLIEKHKNSTVFTVLNSNILKTMAKAKYTTSLQSHYGLSLENYTHFTSPIRRYCDLTVHRILTEFLYYKKTQKNINKKYRNFLSKAVKEINKSEITAIKLERTCESYFKAEFMTDKIDQKFDAIITTCTKNGMFIQLSNTIEGFVKIETLISNFIFDGFYRLVSKDSGKQFAVGQKIKVKCTAVNVNSGNIDFIVENENN